MFDQMDRIVRRANPVPDVDALDMISSPVLLLNEQRSEGVQTQEKVKVDPGPQPPRRGWAVVLAGALVVIVVGALLLASRADSEPAPVASEPAPVEEASRAPEVIARRFLEARTTWNSEAAMVYLSEDAAVEVGPADSPATLPLEMAWQNAAGLVVRLDECTASEEVVQGESTSVSCAVTIDGAIASANGIDPYSGGYEFEVLDGMITSVSFSDFGSYSRSEWGPFGDWVLIEHREDVLEMYGEITRESVLLTPESLELWRRYTSEYVEIAAEQLAVNFLTARAVWDSDEAVSYLSDDAIVEMGPAHSVASLPLEMAWQEASGLVITADECAAGAVSDSDGKLAVSCTVLVDGAIGRANGVVPYQGKYDFEVLDGAITSALMTDLGSYSDNEWEPFGAWVAFNHTRDVVRMYEDLTRSGMLLTPSSLDLWREYTAEYVAEHASD